MLQVRAACTCAAGQLRLFAHMCQLECVLAEACSCPGGPLHLVYCFTALVCLLITAAAAAHPPRALRDDSELVHLPVSVDTYHARVAAAAVAAGADMVNDVTGGLQDPAMLGTVARLGVPYCLMHMRGDLANMTQVGGEGGSSDC